MPRVERGGQLDTTSKLVFEGFNFDALGVWGFWVWGFKVPCGWEPKSSSSAKNQETRLSSICSG